MKKLCSLLLALCLCLSLAPAAHADNPWRLDPLSGDAFTAAANALDMGDVFTLAESLPELGFSYTELYAKLPTSDVWYFGSIQRITSDDASGTSYLTDSLCSYYLQDIGFVSQALSGDNYRGYLFAVDTAHTHFTSRFSAVLQIEDVILVLDFSNLEDLRRAMNALGCGGIDLRFLENYDDLLPVDSPMIFGMAMESFGYSLSADLSGSDYPAELCYAAGIRPGEAYDALCVQAWDEQQARGLFSALYQELDSSSPINLNVYRGDNYEDVLLYEPGFLLRVENMVYLVYCDSVYTLDVLLDFLDFQLH